MSPLAVPSAITSTLPAVNIHPHGHGHKKGSLTDPFASSSTGAQTPAGSTQNLFGNLFNSLQRIIGAQPALAAAPNASITHTAASSAAAASTAAGTTVAGLKINLMA